LENRGRCRSATQARSSLAFDCRAWIRSRPIDYDYDNGNRSAGASDPSGALCGTRWERCETTHCAESADRFPWYSPDQRSVTCCSSPCHTSHYRTPPAALTGACRTARNP
jgi:hypothetical protein